MPEELKPDQDEPLRPLKSERWMKVVYITVGVLLLLGLSAFFWLRRIDAEHQRILADAKQALAELAVPEVSDEQNAARLYEKAFASFSMPPRDLSNNYYGRVRRCSIEIGSPEITKLLADNAAALSALAEASAKPDCVFITDYSDPMVGRKEPSLMHARTAAHLLALAAMRAAHDGNHREAARRLRQILCLARAIGRTETLICYMIAGAIDGEIAGEAFRAVLTRTDPDAEALEAMLGALEEHIGARPPVGKTQHAERLFLMRWAAEIAANYVIPRQDWRGDWRFRLRRSAGLVLRDARAWERLWDRYEECLSMPYPERLREVENMVKDPEYASRSELLGSPYAIMSSFDGAVRSDAGCLAMLRCIRLAVACRLHKLRAGAPPVKLEELAGHFPRDFAEAFTDPFSGKPLLYRRSETGFTIYSIGDDFRDNGATQPYDNMFFPDVVFTVDRALWEAYRAKCLSPGTKPVAPRY
jgi:hypothetical protein